MKPLVVIGFLGSTLDASKFGPTRWGKWRPTVRTIDALGVFLGYSVKRHFPSDVR